MIENRRLGGFGRREDREGVRVLEGFWDGGEGRVGGITGVAVIRRWSLNNFSPFFFDANVSEKITPYGGNGGDK